MDDQGEKAPPAASATKWVFPRSLKQVEEPEENEPRDILCSMTRADALALCARLEGNGIACETALNNEQLVDIMVVTADLAPALQLRDAGEPQLDPDEEEFEKEIAERNVENYICLKCRKRTLELMSLSGPWRIVQKCCIGILGLLIAGWLIWQTLPPRTLKDLESMAGLWETILALCIGTLIWIFVGVKRKKICVECGWQSTEMQ